MVINHLHGHWDNPPSKVTEKHRHFLGKYIDSNGDDFSSDRRSRSFLGGLELDEKTSEKKIAH